MIQSDLQIRTKQFALNAIKLFIELPKSDVFRVLGNQFIRSATSVGANYRAATLSRSKKEFYAKLCIVLEESDECVYWLDLIEESGNWKTEKMIELKKEIRELVLIFSKSRKTARESLTGSDKK